MPRHTWRNGDVAQCGANLVQIAALDGGGVLVVGGGLFGPWSIWVDASQLQRAEQQDHYVPQATRRMDTAELRQILSLEQFCRRE